jgi:hypothetical protein
MLNRPEVFSVKPVTFEQGNADPFGFVDLAENVGGMYVPFSGSISRIRYFIFLPIVELLLRELMIPDRAKKNVQRRLEKLFVYVALNDYKLPPRSGILGSSLIKDVVNPFDPSPGTWIVGDCFKLHSSSVKRLGLTKDKFMDKLKNAYLTSRFVSFIRVFLSEKRDAIESKKWLSNQWKSQVYKGTIYDFNKPIRPDILRFLSKFIFESDQVRRLTDRYPLLVRNPEKYINKIRQDKKYPFSALNDFFLNTFDALLTEDRGEQNSLWEKAYKSLQDVRESHAKILLKSDRVRLWRDASSPALLITRLAEASEKNAKGWFRYDNGSIIRGPRLPGSFLESRGYADFRLSALKSIINDLNKEGVR